MTYPIKGSCQCGQLTYELLKAPKKVIACHCKECQILSTSAFSVTAMVAEEDIKFKGKMKEWGRPADSGNRSHAKFCPYCGNRVYHFNPEAPEIVKLKLRPVDSSVDHIFEPTAHIWLSSKVSWFEPPEGVEQFEKQP